MQKISKYKSSIIIISGEYSLISQICNSEYVYKCFSKPFDFKELEKSIKDMVHEHKNGKHNKTGNPQYKMIFFFFWMFL